MTGPSWYAVIDGAQDEKLLGLIERCATRTCLFAGDMSRTLAAAAPWLVRIDPGEPLLPIWGEHGVGRNWGIQCESPLAIDALRKLLRRFLQAKLPDGTVALFRFYDPRVFATYIAAATPEERTPWFTDVGRYVVEKPDGGEHDFRLRDGRLMDGAVAIG